jgi:mxaJ protein
MRWSRLATGTAAALLSLAASAAGQAPSTDASQGQDKVLRVCQDPNNLPFSNRAEAGFENKIAALFAQQLGWKLEHTWFPQRMGFIRNTLRAKEPNSERFKCDLVTGVPVGFDLGATTHAYYRSTYAMAYLQGRGLDGVKSLDDLSALNPEQRKKLKLGVFAGSPVTEWLLENGLIDQVVSYQNQTGDAEQYPGQIVERDLASGKIDVAFVWGPIAGYFAKNARPAAVVSVPLKSRPGMKLDFEIAMAVRFGEKDFKQRIDQLIEANRPQIGAILEQYGVPLLDQQGLVLAPHQR